MSYLFNVEKFEAYRTAHPELRYFQALANFLGVSRVEVVFKEEGELVREDTFYWHDDK